MKLLKNATVMSVAVLLSRFLGLIREQITSFLFGAGMHTDAYFVAFRIPNLFRDLFAEGALSSAFVSVFSKIDNPQERKSLARNMGLILVWMLLILCLILIIFAPQIIGILSDNFTDDPEKFSLTTQLTRVLTPFLLFVSLAALSMGILNSLGHYFIPALGSAAFNLISIVVGGGLAYWEIHSTHNLNRAIMMFALGTLLGGLFQWLIQWPSMKKENISRDLGFRNIFFVQVIKEAWSDPRIRRVFKIMMPSILSVGAMQINVMVNTYFASSLQEGSVSWLYYSFRLVHFPMGVFGVSLFMATLPQLSKLTENKVEFADTLQTAVRYSLILSVASTLGLWLMAEPIVSLVFERGRFDRFDTTQTALALQCYAYGILAFSLTKIFASVFYAFEKIWVPSFIGVLSIVSNFALSYFLSRTLGHQGIALAVALSSFVSIVLLAFFIRQKEIALWSVKSTKALVGVLIASMVFVLAYYLHVSDELMTLKDRTNFMYFASVTLLAVLAIGGAYMGIVALFVEEGRVIFNKILRRKR